jgi:hypothetical protein
MLKNIITLLLFITSSAYAQRISKKNPEALKDISKDYQREHFVNFKLITDMLDSSKKVTFARYNMKSLERNESGISSSSTSVKLQMHPRKSYLINTEKKLEILYNEGELNNKCLLKPHVFPYFTLTLDPHGNLMRKNQHFTVLEVGFDFMAKTIAVALSKEKEQLANHLTYVGKVEKNKMLCHLLVYENVSFSYTDYTVLHKETVSSIAAKFTVNDYMLRCKNKLYDSYGYLKEGSTIKIPTYYCKKAIFYIDEKTMLPVSVNIYDELGLFESYDTYNIELNKPIPTAEFKRNFKGYGF